MTLNLDRNGWERVRFGDVVRQVKDSTDPVADGVKRYVAGEHMDSDSLAISRWGLVGDGYLGPAFHRKFKSGQVLYGSRRTYLRKVALAEFDGVCANTTFVMESADPSRLLPDLLPFVMSTEAFHAHSIAESKGSVNPYVNWPDIAKYEFELPPRDQQARISALLWAMETSRRSLLDVQARAVTVLSLTQDEVWTAACERVILEQLVRSDRPICYGVVQPGDFVQTEGVKLLRIQDIENGAIEASLVRSIAAGVDQQYERSRVVLGDIVISIVGTIGRVAEVPSSLDGANISRALARFSADQTKIYPQYLLEVLQSPSMQQLLNRTALDSTRAVLNLSDLRNLSIPVPSRDEQVSQANRIHGARAVTLALRDELESLSTLRRALLDQVLGVTA